MFGRKVRELSRSDGLVFIVPTTQSFGAPEALVIQIQRNDRSIDRYNLWPKSSLRFAVAAVRGKDRPRYDRLYSSLRSVPR